MLNHDSSSSFDFICLCSWRQINCKLESTINPFFNQLITCFQRHIRAVWPLLWGEFHWSAVNVGLVTGLLFEDPRQHISAPVLVYKTPLTQRQCVHLSLGCPHRLGCNTEPRPRRLVPLGQFAWLPEPVTVTLLFVVCGLEVLAVVPLHADWCLSQILRRPSRNMNLGSFTTTVITSAACLLVPRNETLQRSAYGYNTDLCPLSIFHGSHMIG
jgi:hypothetical protein